MSRETTEQKWMRDYMAGPKDHFFRVENIVASGTFDTYFCILGSAGWIEIKAPIEPVRATSKLFADNHKFTVDQKNFALSVRRAGGNCWGFIGTNLRQMLIPAKAIQHANEMTVTELVALAAWHREKGKNGAKLDGRRLRYVLAGRPYEPIEYESLK